jgi:EAL domain-containing protein (putative c-di-GMP-specific phosphodiesterase class I)
MADETPNAAREAARRLFDTRALLVDDWRRLSWADRQRFAVDVTVLASALRGSSTPENGHVQGPTAEAIRDELEAPAGDVHLQPIVRLSTGQVVGYEALSRFPGWTPDRWFRQALVAGLGLEFELAAVDRAVGCLRRLPGDAFLGINVSASTLVSNALLEALADVDASRIVLELTEHEPIVDYSPYCEQLGRLRKRGVRLGIDDVGAGHSSLLHIVQLRPDVIKLDRALIAGCDTDGARRVVTKSMAMLARQAKAALIAEGVETTGEAEALVGTGVRFGQGFLFGGPQPEPFPGPEAGSP